MPWVCYTLLVVKLCEVFVETQVSDPKNCALVFSHSLGRGQWLETSNRGGDPNTIEQRAVILIKTFIINSLAKRNSTLNPFFYPCGNRFLVGWLTQDNSMA